MIGACTMLNRANEPSGVGIANTSGDRAAAVNSSGALASVERTEFRSSVNAANFVNGIFVLAPLTATNRVASRYAPALAALSTLAVFLGRRATSIRSTTVGLATVLRSNRDSSDSIISSDPIARHEVWRPLEVRSCILLHLLRIDCITAATPTRRAVGPSGRFACADRLSNRTYRQGWRCARSR